MVSSWGHHVPWTKCSQSKGYLVCVNLTKINYFRSFSFWIDRNPRLSESKPRWIYRSTKICIYGISYGLFINWPVIYSLQEKKGSRRRHSGAWGPLGVVSPGCVIIRSNAVKRRWLCVPLGLLWDSLRSWTRVWRAWCQRSVGKWKSSTTFKEEVLEASSGSKLNRTVQAARKRVQHDDIKVLAWESRRGRRGPAWGPLPALPVPHFPGRCRDWKEESLLRSPAWNVPWCSQTLDPGGQERVWLTCRAALGQSDSTRSPPA